VGFSLDLKQLVRAVPPQPLRAAIRAPWGDAPGLAAAVAALRREGETVVRVLPGRTASWTNFTATASWCRMAGAGPWCPCKRFCFWSDRQ
jgi:ATP phosphoribosyltransferase regulatory subunit